MSARRPLGFSGVRKSGFKPRGLPAEGPRYREVAVFYVGGPFLGWLREEPNDAIGGALSWRPRKHLQRFLGGPTGSWPVCRTLAEAKACIRARLAAEWKGDSA